MTRKILFVGSSAFSLLVAGGVVADAASKQLPPELLGAQIQVFSAPIGWGANHVYAVVNTGPYAGYVLENTSAYNGPHLGTGTDYDMATDTRANNYIGTFTITNTTVADGYDLATNNCSDLMMQVTQQNNSGFYPGVNWLTQPFSVPAAGSEVPLEGTPAGAAAMSVLQSDASITGTSYDEYNVDPGYGGGGTSDFYADAGGGGSCDDYCS
ncbi:MAG TPA: hypothetical protein VGO00_29050 [Kofleriaceae bacterium]|nr:hypothetical protein [Kofleriaceae bacterium]